MVAKNLTALATALLIVILVLSNGVLQVEQHNNLTAKAQPVFPFTVTTNGNAWNGVISYGLSGPGGNYAVIMNADGTILYTRSSSSPYGVVKNIGLNTFLFQGEPQVDGLGYDPTYATHIWNPVTNTTLDFPNVVGHHDVAYDPLNNTFLTLQTYARTVGSDTYLIDKIVQFDALGNILWTWDAYNYIPLSEQDPYNLTAPYDGTQVTDFTHSNALIWDYQDNVIYLNVRHINTFYKIDQNTGNVIWSCGQYGTITLVDSNGNPLPDVNGYPPSLWFHSHDLEMVGPDVFTMFDNDYDNTTNFNDATSELLEITVNETSMTAQTTWNWEAPPQYYTEYLGANILLPNGDWMGDFGSPTHQFEENYPWNFVDSGADIIEVTPAGQIVRTISFPTGWSIYRVSLVTELNASASSPVPFGNMNVGSSNQWGNSRWLASAFTSPDVSGTLTDITAYVYGDTSGFGQCALYADNGGSIGSLLATGSDAPTGTGSPQWCTSTISYAFSPNTVYWLAFTVHSAGSWYDSETASSTAQQVYESASYWTSPDPFDVGDYRNVAMSIYADYTTSTSPAPSPSPSPSPSPTETFIPVVAATASSYNGPYTPQMAIDGIESTSNYWGTSASLGLPQWLQLDLGSVVTINEVYTHFYDGDARVYTYYIQTSTDGSAWTTVVSSKTGSSAVTDTFSDVSARYIRITVTDNTANTAAHIEQAKVYSG